MVKTTRRVRWYQQTLPTLSIRLSFDDQYGRVSRYFVGEYEATVMYEAFIAGKFTTWDLMKENDKAAKRDMEDAHSQGLHDEIPRDGCPECERQRGRT